MGDQGGADSDWAQATCGVGCWQRESCGPSHWSARPGPWVELKASKLSATPTRSEYTAYRTNRL